MDNNSKRIDELAKKVKKGDQKAFEELYKLTSARAYFTALQICSDKQDAEDILQESYITALNRISSLERTESFMSWFNKIVVNKSRDYLRKKNPKPLTGEDEWLLEGQIDDNESFSPESNVDKEELKTEVMDALKELSAEKRTCVMMRYFNDMSVNEIAQTMEVPVSTVKNRLFDARKELKKLFERKGITAAYSLAPFGVVGWAFNTDFESISQTFNNSPISEKIFSGIAAASTAALSTAVGTAATGTGIFAKAAAGTTIQKVVSGIVVAGVVTGSTIGITTAIKNTKNKNTPSASYSDTVDSSQIPDPDNAEVNVIQKNPDTEEDDTHESIIIDYKVPGNISMKVDYIGELKEGRNHITFEDDAEMYYVNFKAEKDGYYSFACDYDSPLGYCYIAVPENSGNGEVSSFINYEGDYHSGWLYHLEEGDNTLVVAMSHNFNADESDINVKYIGEEITDVIIDESDLNNVILGYDETADGNIVLWQDQSAIEEGLYANFFIVNFVFSDGTVYDSGKCALSYHIKDGQLKEGRNTAVFSFFGKNYEKEIYAHPITDYVKNIEISNLEQFASAKIGEEGFVYDWPEEYEITVTYADGSKETFDGKTWDKTLEFDNGTELRVLIYNTSSLGAMDYQLRSREPVTFVVAIGNHKFIDRVCVIEEFDVTGYRKSLDKNNLTTAKEYKGIIEDFYEQAEKNAESAEDYFRYSYELADITGYYSLKLIKKIAGYELDYAITTYKILTENEFQI